MLSHAKHAYKTMAKRLAAHVGFGVLHRLWHERRHTSGGIECLGIYVQLPLEDDAQCALITGHHMLR